MALYLAISFASQGKRTALKHHDVVALALIETAVHAKQRHLAQFSADLFRGLAPDRFLQGLPSFDASPH
jgi:hypothetical protein